MLVDCPSACGLCQGKQIGVPFNALVGLGVEAHLRTDMVVEKERDARFRILQNTAESAAPTVPKSDFSFLVTGDGFFRLIRLQQYAEDLQTVPFRFVFNGFELAHK